MAGSTTLVDHGSVRAAASLRGDGTPYRFEMVHASGTFRTYADEPAELVAALIPDYPGERDPVAAAAARMRHAVHAQVVAQAAINVELGTEGCTSEQRAVLCGNRSAPPVPTCWTAPVPLVLVDCFYAPITALPRPVAEAPGELLWIRTSTDWDHLRSLADLGVVVLSEHRSATATPRPAPGV